MGRMKICFKSLSHVEHAFSEIEKCEWGIGILSKAYALILFDLTHFLAHVI